MTYLRIKQQMSRRPKFWRARETRLMFRGRFWDPARCEKAEQDPLEFEGFYIRAMCSVYRESRY